MKKCLMLLGLFSAFASFGSVYVIQMNVTTTTPKEGTLKATSNYCEEEGKIAYRQIGKVKIKVVMWGDGCGADSGLAVWNETQKIQYSADSEFAWEFLNRIGKAGRDAEGLWTAELYHDNDERDHAAHLYGAGTGKVQGTDELSLSGNFAGYMYAGQLPKVEKTPGCAACGAGLVVTVLDAIGWGLCDCMEADERTAAHGTWTLKYDKKASASYEAGGDIAAAYKFPSYVEL